MALTQLQLTQRNEKGNSTNKVISCSYW